MKELAESFTNPPAACRGKPFWAWNGKLEEAELRRQIRVFREMGLGGAFMHSRVGLATPYLSEEWFRLVGACADECRKLKMEAWAYDEDRWPSGAAGGLVTRDERFRARSLVMRVGEPDKVSTDGALAAFAGRPDKNVLRYAHRIGAADRIGGAELVLAFRSEVAGPSPWYNDQTYLDTLSPDAVGKFIEVTHEAYARSVGASFGRVIPGIFTDEPNYHQGDGPASVPWTDDLPRVFRERYGYDLLEHLPELFFFVEGRELSKARRDFYDCATHLFTTSFSKQIGEWCGRHGIAFTGHALAEESLGSQTAEVGAAMRFYEYQQAPGIDILCGQGLERPGGRPPEYLTAKQCASVAHQFGRPWVLSELYGCTGWQFTFAEHKSVGDWQAALGITLRCPHLSPYTLLGEAKRDYPAAISFQSPWWKDYPRVENYFSRLGVWLTRGEPVRDVAVLHPIESGWAVRIPGDSGGIDQLNGGLEAVQAALLEAHWDFDYLDEDLLARHGGIEGGELKMGSARYRAVVVPPLLTIRKTTLGMLAKFADAGGRVIFAGPPPACVDVEPSNEPAALARRTATANGAAAVPGMLAGIPGLRRVAVTSPGGTECPTVLYQMRREPSGRTIVFLCQTKQRSGTGPVTVRIPAAGQVQEWDAATGEIRLAEARPEDGGVSIATDLPGCGSRLFVVDPAPDSGLNPRPALREARQVALPAGPWAVDLDEPNAMPLDCPEFSIAGGGWQPAKEILFVDRAVRDAAGLRHRGGAMVQPWAAAAPKDEKAVAVKLRYRFDVEALPAGPVHLVMEQPDRFTIVLNGDSVPPAPDGWWIDPAFRRIPIPASALRQGKNELVLETAYRHDSGLEAMYLAGDFGARWQDRRAVLTAPPRALAAGDWRFQGLPCYSGGVTYRMDAEVSVRAGDRAVLVLPAWEGTLVRVAVNGTPAGQCGWPPYEVDLTGALGTGRNTIGITVVSSRRNLLGPLHNSEVYPGWTGPWEFVDTKRWTGDYVSVPYGLTAPPVLSIRGGR